MNLRGSFRWVGLALLGIVIAAAVALAASHLASQQIGIASESVSAGDSLAPPVTSSHPRHQGDDGGQESGQSSEGGSPGGGTEPGASPPGGEPEAPIEPTEEGTGAEAPSGVSPPPGGDDGGAESGGEGRDD